MARTKTPPAAVRLKHKLSERLANLRAEQFGDRGGPELARRLGLPVRTWYNYEAGVTVPGEVILGLIELTSVEPMWLLHGSGPKFRRKSGPESVGAEVPPASVEALVQAALTLLEDGGSGTDDRSLRMSGNAMAPIILDGGYVEVADTEEPPEQLDGKIVAACVDGETVIRRFRLHGRFARLCPERKGSDAAEIVVDLTQPSKDRSFRRVVRINTPH